MRSWEWRTESQDKGNRGWGERRGWGIEERGDESGGIYLEMIV